MKIAFAGAFGVGKSTLARWLAQELGYTLIPDFSRELRILGLYPDRGRKQSEHYAYTLWKQIRIEGLNNDFVSDSATYTTLCYSFLDRNVYSEDMEKAILKYTKYDKLFYIPIEVPLVSDSIRTDCRKHQQKVDRTYRAFLRDHDIKFITVSGTLTERKKKILNYVISEQTSTRETPSQPRP